MTLEITLKELEEVLYGLNYVVLLRLYQMKYSQERSTQQYVNQALGPKATIYKLSTVKGEEVISQVEEVLRYKGDIGHGPDAAAMETQKFEVLLGTVLSHLRQAASDATSIEQLWLEGGYPVYPVFWDFAFMVSGPRGAELFIGASSD